MIFTETKFWWFFCIVLAFVYANWRYVRSVQIQNLLLLVSSYYFYAQWDWRFLSLIIISTLVDYTAGQKIAASRLNKKAWLAFSLITNLGILGFFKYFDFFITEAVNGLSAIGVQADPWTLNVILPVGISFYTFQTLTYTIDIYRGKLEPTRDLTAFAAYVAFFPQLVAGPIERASNLLPQFSNLWRFEEDRIIQGLRLIMFGLALKVGVADQLAPYVDEIFSAPDDFSGGTLALGSMYFAFQIYGDFCGYSTIAIGLAKILGFELMTNFRTPYFAVSMQDFWRRWHISLSTFFRDYVYIPLGGSRATPLKNDRNLLLTFTVSGLWHGANWTFVIWGFYHGLLLAIERRLPAVMARGRWTRPLLAFGKMGLTFLLVCVGWVFFRAESVGDAINFLSSLIVDLGIPDERRSPIIFVLFAVLIDFIWHADTRLEQTDVALLNGRNALFVRWCSYMIMFWVVIVGIANRSGIQQFIYFQF